MRNEADKELKRSTEVTEEQQTSVLSELLKSIRLDRMAADLQKETANKADADQLIQEFKISVQDLLESRRGWPYGQHGFIGERAQCFIMNIRSAVNGDEFHYILLDDDSATDYLVDGIKVQQKACMAGGKLGLDHILMHIRKYPLFKETGYYQIPKDLYEIYIRLKNMPAEIAGKLRNDEYSLWKTVQNFTKQEPDARIEPMCVTYKEIQVGAIDDTISRVEQETEKTNAARKAAVVDANQPTLSECIKTAGVSAAFGGVAEGRAAVVQKAIDGKTPKDYDKEDVRDIAVSSAAGAAKGAVRGAAVYGMVNCLNIPGEAASGIVTLGFDAAAEAKKLSDGKIDAKEFAVNMAWDMTDVGASTAGAAIGKALFPKKYKALGSVIGSISGMILWRFGKKAIIDYMQKREDKAA